MGFSRRPQSLYNSYRQSFKFVSGSYIFSRTYFIDVALISHVVTVMIMAGNNTGDMMISVSDAPFLLRNVDEDVSAEAKLMLRAAEDDKLEYMVGWADGRSEYGGGKWMDCEI